MDIPTIQTARYTLAFSWIYHGLFPKLITVAPLEKAMTATIGLSEQASYLLTKAAGASEIIFGVLIFVFYRNRKLIMVNAFALLALGVFVAIQMPSLLIEAFNPVTTNATLLALSYILIRAENVNPP